MKVAIRFSALLWLVLTEALGWSQSPFNWSVGPGASTFVDGIPMAHPFTGGLSAPQWSMIDLDWDGDDDLFAFDRDGYRIMVFENTGAGWVERPDWSVGWPEVEHWVLLRDFDCDGLPDLFTGYQNGIHVWKNTSEGPGIPAFEPFATPLMASWDFGSGAQSLPVVCLTIDKPAIFDVDSDGDLDFICFTETSTTLYRFSGQTPCELELTCTNRCYGMVSEGTEDNSLFIGPEHICSFNVTDPEGRPVDDMAQRDGVHAGGAVTALQVDGEHFHDLLISDVTYPTMSGLFLEDASDGQDSTAWVDPSFPALVPHDGPADSMMLARFPAAYPIDPDADGDWDLVISPNVNLEIDDDRCVQLWENQGTLNEPVWALVNDAWIQDGMIDVGRGAIPNLADLDGDGDFDLLVGNKERYEGVNTTPSALALFENTGSSTEPVFEWRTWSAVDFEVNGIESAFPALGDLDEDGDLDLIVGDELGLLHYYENTAGAGNWPQWQMAELSVSDDEGNAIDVGQFAAPQLVDVNGDNQLDLVVGEKNGTLSLYLGCNGPENFTWCPVVTEEFGSDWAGIQVNSALGINGYSTPALYRTADALHVFVGNELGKVQYYGTVQPGDWTAGLSNQSDDVVGNGRGLRASACLNDLTGDGIPELLVGIGNGGIRWYSGVTVGFESATHLRNARVYPNPAKIGTPLQCEVPASLRNSNTIIRWTDMSGRTSETHFSHDGPMVAPTVPGIYLLTISQSHLTWTSRIVVMP